MAAGESDALRVAGAAKIDEDAGQPLCGCW